MTPYMNRPRTNWYQRNTCAMEILRPDSYEARKTINMQRKNFPESSCGQSYAHVKVPHAPYLLHTPLTSLQLPNYYAFAPLWHSEAAKGALRATR